MDRDGLSGGGRFRADGRHPRPCRAVRVPVPCRTLRELDDPGAGIAVRSDRRTGRVSWNIDFSPLAGPLWPNRARGADRDVRKERHFDRRIRQGPARGRHGHPRGRSARCADAVCAVMMTSFAFILGVYPLVVAQGAAEISRHSVGTPVFAGMIAASAIGLFVIPMLYVTFQTIRERSSARFRRLQPSETD